MKNFIVGFLAFLTAATLVCRTSAQTRFGAYGFDHTGTFQLTLPGGTELDVSHDLKTWTKLATLAQEVALDDLASRQMDRRFYRMQGGSGSGEVIGWVKVAIPAGKIAVVGNPFSAPLRFDTAEGRYALFGITNPPIKLLVYTNGSFAPHQLEVASGTWEPRLSPIRLHQGFSIQNLGRSQLTLRMAGEVSQGRSQTLIPAGTTLLTVPVQHSPSLGEALTSAAKDGATVQWFDEPTQTYKTSTFDSLSGKGNWTPPLPEFRPGRAIIVKTPAPMAWTNNVALPAR
jgi:hypothetical protein